ETRASSSRNSGPQGRRAVFLARSAFPTLLAWRLAMTALIWKELRENLKWVPLPGLVILLVVLIDKPDEPMLDLADAYFFCLTAVVFGPGLGFVQVYFEARGDARSMLLHRPLSPSRIFLAKALGGVGLYLLALGIPFLCLEGWMATPGK